MHKRSKRFIRPTADMLTPKESAYTPTPPDTLLAAQGIPLDASPSVLRGETDVAAAAAFPALARWLHALSWCAIVISLLIAYATLSDVDITLSLLTQDGEVIRIEQ